MLPEGQVVEREGVQIPLEGEVGVRDRLVHEEPHGVLGNPAVGVLARRGAPREDDAGGVQDEALDSRRRR